MVNLYKSMKSVLFSLLSVFLIGTSAGQTVTGKVVDVATGEALVYVNVGVVGQPRGTITDVSGVFVLEITGLSAEASVRFSMIGYMGQNYTVKELSDKNGKTIMLESAPFPLSEVLIKPKKPRKIGTTNHSLTLCCGWGGDKRGKGYEIGTKMELGVSPVHFKSLHIRIRKLSFDTCILRLHVRKIINELPADELLTQNIYISITKETGWVEFDLSKYHLVFQEDVSLSLEWISVMGDNKNKHIRVNKSPPAPQVLFNCSKNRAGVIYTRWGSEAQWKRSEGAPCFYLTVM